MSPSVGSCAEFLLTHRFLKSFWVKKKKKKISFGWFISKKLFCAVGQGISWKDFVLINQFNWLLKKLSKGWPHYRYNSTHNSRCSNDSLTVKKKDPDINFLSLRKKILVLISIYSLKFNIHWIENRCEIFGVRYRVSSETELSDKIQIQIFIPKL